MFKVLFDIIIDLLATVIQILVYPINTLIVATLPDFSSKIVEITNTFSTITGAMVWPLSAVPSSVKITLSFIIVMEIAKHTIFRNTYALVRVWTLIQRIKFW